jgi:DNA modification methylase
MGRLKLRSRHRLLCGDSTKAEDVARLFDGATATMVHADPPYGMGKEKDGVANDNLYSEKLDAFQMEWWQAWRPHLPDNGSAYIWGNAPDLWRLWYCGGLSESERMTIRNEIVWDKANESGKYDGNGIGSSIGRQFACIAERCRWNSSRSGAT